MRRNNPSAGKIPREFIDDLLVRVDIVDLIDSHLPLKKVGNNYVACCPFHTEKTPSFSVSRSKQFFHCFGCGASGNAISFLIDFHHLDFVEAVEDLAHFVGIDVPREVLNSTESAPQKENLSQLYDVMEKIATVYKNQLKTHSLAQNYLQNRGISGVIAKQFSLGYAPDAWQTLADNFNQDLLLATGMLIRNDEGKSYDRFRQRIMFPIRNKRGFIVGFGGRVLDNSLPKYLNSPETALFHKGSQVYGLYELLQKNAKPARIIIVEGYMDVIALAQFGIDYAVATLGTATSAQQLQLLFRFSHALVFCFDGDNAGQSAAWKVMETVFNNLTKGRQVRIMLLPAQHDPDSLIRAEGVEKFTQRIDNAQVLSDYFFGSLEKQLNLSELEGRAQLIDKAKVYLEKLPTGSYRDLMFARLSAQAQLAVNDTNATTNSVKKPLNALSQPSLQRQIIIRLIQNPQLIEVVNKQAINWQNLQFSGAEAFQEILQLIAKEKPPNTGKLIQIFYQHRYEAFIKELANPQLLVFNDYIDAQGIEKEFSDALQKFCDKYSPRPDTNRAFKAKNSEILNEAEKQLLFKLAKR